MEKMGWEKGKGLGANLSGNVDHISLRHKDNNKGIGFEGHDDTWLAHQDDFQVNNCREVTGAIFQSYSLI